MATKILIVEDEYINRILFEKVLADANYDYDSVRDEGDALEALRKYEYALVLLDLRIPPNGFESGFSLLKHKSRTSINKKTKVIIITGALDEKSIQARDKPEFFVEKVLLKPVDDITILDAIEKTLGGVYGQSLC